MKKLLRTCSKYKKMEGFTLIELLVVIIITSVLSGIAFPSFLNQVSKAKGAEAKSSLGAINRSQQSYRFQHSSFASNLNNLDFKVKSKFYTYDVVSSSSSSAAHQTTPVAEGLKLYSSWVSQSSDVFTQVICESNETSTNSSITLLSNNCPNTYSIIE